MHRMEGMLMRKEGTDEHRKKGDNNCERASEIKSTDRCQANKANYFVRYVNSKYGYRNKIYN
jgi:hypothetical protein